MNNSTHSQNKEILAYLKQGHKLTSLEALNLFGSLRLSGRIFDLRKAGHDIQMTMIETSTGKHIAQYYLPREFKQEKLF